MNGRLKTSQRVAYVAASILLSLAGVAGFIYLFVRDFNLYWLILSPVIIALYQIPAVFVFWLYRRRTGRKEDDPGSDAPPGGTGEAGQDWENGTAAPRDPQA
jgi:membrane protein YdbS with pleckstrin-like domain